MTAGKKEFETELIVTNVRSKNDSVILSLRLTKPRIEKSTEQRLGQVIEPLPKSQMEKMGSDIAKGYMNVLQKQMQQSTQMLQPLFPPRTPPHTLQITISKQEYSEIGRPTIDDKLILKLKMKAAS